MGVEYNRKTNLSFFFTTLLLVVNFSTLFYVGIISSQINYRLHPVDGVIEEDTLQMKYLFSRVLGGRKDDIGKAIGIDSQDRVVITGNTDSAGFPVINAYDSSYNGPTDIYFYGDAFISSFFPNGTLYWSTYFGGLLSDHGADLVIDSQDNIIITGSTDSSDFPVLNAADPDHNGNEDAFLAKFSSKGELIWSTFLGDVGYEFGEGVAVDSFDNIYITGGWETSPLGSYFLEAYVAKYSPNGALEWIEKVGGSLREYGMGITIDSQNYVIITGNTDSSDFPNTNEYQGSQQEIFLIKLNQSGGLVWSNVIGGSSDDYGRSVQTDKDDNLILAGMTVSTDYPTKNAEDSFFDGSIDIIISKFNRNGTMLWSTFLGGNHNDMTGKIYVDNQGRIYVSGVTFSMDYPLTNTSQSYLLSESNQAFLTILNPEGFILWSETVGANQGNYISDRGYALVADTQQNVIIVGSTYSIYFPVTTNDGYLDGADVFICSLFNPFKERPIWSDSTSSTLNKSSITTKSISYIITWLLVFIILGSLVILLRSNLGWRER
ncbi:MAG: SBBP repeat-containing protein [Candidatus Hodarchaeota archaeon]